MRWARRSDRTLAAIYGAAVSACADEAAAADVTIRVGAAGVDDARRQTAEAVRLAMEGEPHPAFAPLPLGEREALALARVAGLDVAEIAALTGRTADEVKAQLSMALRRLAAGVRVEIAA